MNNDAKFYVGVLDDLGNVTETFELPPFDDEIAFKEEENNMDKIKFQIGDTIYIKDTVAGIEYDDSTVTYYGDCNGWLDNSCIIDELPAEPVKPALPKNVAKELEAAKDAKLTFYTYVHRSRSTYDYPATDCFIFFEVNNDESDRNMEQLSRAWFHGYEIEREKLYNLVLGYDPGDNDGDTCNALNKQGGGLFIDVCSYPDDDLKTDPDYQFTQDEINKYNQDFWIKGIDLNDYKVEVKD